METREENRQLVHAMIHLAHNLNLQVVAEGVETAEQLTLLRGFGCDQVQGYLISKALPLDAFAEFLQRGSAQQWALGQG
jgi:EAL domain-containing protein (putative c-di-GMP-specific phosphodiesterase class I)